MGSMQTGSGDTSKTGAFNAPRERCPFAPTLPATFHHEGSASTALATSFNELQTHDAVIAQTQSKLRISRSRTRQKRGPPTLSLS
jgi:hypothetical protein